MARFLGKEVSLWFVVWLEYCAAACKRAFADAETGLHLAGKTTFCGGAGFKERDDG
jgi:hypothetical protein